MTKPTEPELVQRVAALEVRVQELTDVIYFAVTHSCPGLRQGWAEVAIRLNEPPI